jgi:hypothetical protein
LISENAGRENAGGAAASQSAMERKVTLRNDTEVASVRKVDGT